MTPRATAKRTLAKRPTAKRAVKRTPAPVPAVHRPEGVDALLHTACVKAGAGAALKVVLDRLPLLKPLVPAQLRRATGTLAEERVQRRLVREVYARYRLKPARWEVEAILAVAQSQGVLTPLASRAGLQATLRAWLPSALADGLVRYTPLEPLVSATARAVASSWAAGRYADAVCRLRKTGADWLPAPLASAMRMTPTRLQEWSGEALAMALPPLKLAAALARRVAS